MKRINVGIDLGTTYSAVSTFNKDKGEVEFLKNDMDKDCTPSVVYIENGRVTIGEEAKNEQAAGNQNTAAFYKSFMGEKDYTLYLDDKEYTPEDLSGLYLKELKKIIEEQNNVKIDGAVITVPAYFNEHQRNATLRAGKAAGLNVLKIINEPTAAIIAYGLTGQGKKNVMVYDLGGGTFDVTIAEVNGTKVKVLTTNGNHQLGGKDWDNTLLEELCNRFYDEHGLRIEDYPDNYKELQVQCENAKKKLTDKSATMVSVQCDGYSGKYEITRDFFDAQTANLLNETITLVRKCFDDIGRGFGWHSLDEVVLVGGSTRMPQVKEMVMREYGRPPITKNINVDTIVSAGAAMQAQLCTESQLVLGGSVGKAAQTPGNSNMLVIRGSDIEDITAHSLGMLAMANDEINFVNSIIIPKDSKMGQSFDKQYTFSGENLEVYVLQGESKDPFDCTMLYKYVISGMPKGEKNAFAVEFQYNNNGMVEVQAKLAGGRALSAKQMPITESLNELIARLRKEREEAKNRVQDVEIIFMLDTSYSMVGNPMTKAKQAMRDFVQELDLKRTKIAILDFADRSRWACDFTNSERTLLSTIDTLNVDGPCGIANDETPLSNHGKAFKDRKAAKIIVVLTDGVWADQRTEVRAAERLKQDGITIYAVGFGGADESFLSSIASEKGARKIDLSNLSSTFKEIASSIATEV